MKPDEIIEHEGKRFAVEEGMPLKGQLFLCTCCVPPQVLKARVNITKDYMVLRELPAETAPQTCLKCDKPAEYPSPVCADHEPTIYGQPPASFASQDLWGYLDSNREEVLRWPGWMRGEGTLSTPQPVGDWHCQVCCELIRWNGQTWLHRDGSNTFDCRKSPSCDGCAKCGEGTMKKMSPRKAKTFKQQCSLGSDNHITRGFWILLQGANVVLTAQQSGEKRTAKIEIPRRQFNALIDWYNREQNIKGRAAREVKK